MFWRVVTGADETWLDRALRRNRRRFADRVAVVLAAVGVATIVLATVHDGLMHLSSSDLIGVGGVVLTGAGLMVSLAPTDTSDPSEMEQ